jgi:hypothetical protein
MSFSTIDSLKKGFGKFVTPIKLFIPKETVFALQEVCLPKILPNQEKQNTTIVENARTYTHSTLLKYQTEFNESKQKWLEEAKTFKQK